MKPRGISVRSGAIAIKRGMTALWDPHGARHPVTLLHVDAVQVTDVRPRSNVTRDPKQWEVQMAAVDQPKARKTSSPLRGHYTRAGVSPKKHIASFPVTPDAAEAMKMGMEVTAAHFVPGQFVDVQARTIGKGFQGAMKRWGFKGLRASHGVSVAHRHMGSTGQSTTPGRVVKGKKMPGRMGGNHVSTVQNLRVLKVDQKLGLLWVRGGVPGHDGVVVRVTDAVKKRMKGAFPVELAQVPFPTYSEAWHGPVEAERMASFTGPDPFVPSKV